MIVIKNDLRKKSCGASKSHSFFTSCRNSRANTSKNVQPTFSIGQINRFFCRKKFYKITYFCIWSGIVIGLYFLAYWQVENDIIRKDNRAIAEVIVSSNDIDDVINPTDDTIPDAMGNTDDASINDSHDSPYWSYINADVSSINFTNLKSINPQTVVWLKVNNTNINYPVVQTSDNDYYLHHSFSGAKNSHGWVFMDYENTPDFNNRNTIIYAHDRPEGDMFGTLKRMLNSNWQSNTDNRIITTVTQQNEVLLWEVFSTYNIETTNDYIQTNFNSDQQFNDFLGIIRSRSNFDYDVNLNEKDKILTLSTCHGLHERTVAHAKLVAY